jgi:hypothetical protein
MSDLARLILTTLRPIVADLPSAFQCPIRPLLAWTTSRRQNTAARLAREINMADAATVFGRFRRHRPLRGAGFGGPGRPSGSWSATPSAPCSSRPRPDRKIGPLHTSITDDVAMKRPVAGAVWIVNLVTTLVGSRAASPGDSRRQRGLDRRCCYRPRWRAAAGANGGMSERSR